MTIRIAKMLHLIAELDSSLQIESRYSGLVLDLKLMP